ncbi:Fe(2+) transporter permease subunit FeoB [Thiomicrorhabdus sp. 6S3-12]|uniref:Fe(2+) transporter permease subunit FeoB n=1 Tax=Thiomicrorhabdus sp. 6S3-12 TaxID=2819681 RepID=UPI001AAC9141|nr:Fe(2+) transporter permease subunit FeoB [Thiomicrorhabdus sp. 6S3-12]MBO1923905.1 Fe(2+) transporter permease subunit FeoB [Thiomicrorhabdus sp. 6S3-12]
MTVLARNSKSKSQFALQHNVQVALIGSPNCGKTTLFNRLTGSQQTTGNWPGVTVEQKSGYFKLNNQNYHLIDLPGVYSLDLSNHSGLDEKVACNFLQCQPADLIINVVDATSLERQLFLTAQLLHMGLPVVVVLNRMDLLKERNLHIDIDKLSEQLHCPVIPISAYLNKGIDQLKQQLPQYLNHRVDLHFDLPDVLHNSVHQVRDSQGLESEDSVGESCWKTLQMLIHPHTADTALQSFCIAEKQRLEEYYQEDLALIAADLYFQFAHDAAHASEIRTDQFTRNTTDSIDRWVLHPIWGLPIFFGIMYLLFAASIAVGNVFIDFFDLGAQALFVDGTANFLGWLGSPEWLTSLIANGIGGGVQVVATFIPVIGALYLLLSILEDTGYMQRAALIMDNFMRRLGLSGQALVPLVIGFGCNIPAVLASRTLPAQQDRIKTIMMTPFMSCSARLTVYVMFATAFFEENAALIVFSLYMTGILAAVLTAWMLKKTLLSGQARPLLMELPIYHKPTVLNVLINTRNRLKSFILDAGKVIVIVVLILNVLNSLGTDGTFGHDNQETSVLSSIAKSATPIVEPLGITEENWPATVGLFTGLLAKEVVVGSLDALYQQQNIELDSAAEFSLSSSLKEAWQTIPDNLSGIFGDISDPLGLQSIESVHDKVAIAEEQGFSLSTLDKMVNSFQGAIGAYAYLLLILLYFPCVATFGAIKQELGWRWALTSGAWSLFLGYAVAVSFYQIATFSQHPSASSVWLGVFASIFAMIWFTLKSIGRKTAGAPLEKTSGGKA